MAFERVTLPKLSSDENDLLNQLLKQLEDKQPRNLLRASYYDGKHAVRQVGTIIPEQYWRLGIVLGWSAKAVDILARRCNLDGFIWPDGDLESLGFDEFAEANGLTAEISSGIVSALIHGVSFLVNTQGDTASGEPAALIHSKDALNATGEWNSRRRALDNLLSVTSRDDDGKPDGLALYLYGRTITADRDGGRWTVDKQDHEYGMPAEALVYKPRTGRPFGTSRISRPVMSLHDQALRTVVRMEAHDDVYTIPDLWMLGADESIFKNADGTQKASWQIVLGRIKGLPDDPEREGDQLARADVKQFPASSPEPHILSLKQKAQLFSGETSIPLSSLGVSDMSNPTSADSYIASREDLIAEAEGTTEDMNPALRRSIRRGLAMQNGLAEVPASWRSMDNKWRSPLYLSKAQAADAGAKTLGAIPWLADTEVGLEIAGLTPQQAKRAMADKRRAAGRAVLASLTQPPTPQANANGA